MLPQKEKYQSSNSPTSMNVNKFNPIHIIYVLSQNAQSDIDAKPTQRPRLGLSHSVFSAWEGGSGVCVCVCVWGGVLILSPYPPPPPSRVWWGEY